MNKTQENINKRIPIQLPEQRMRQPTREEYKQHPLFAEKMREKLIALNPTYPVHTLPDDFQDMVYNALMQLSFPQCDMPFDVYKRLIETPPGLWGFGEIKKAADLIYNSKPLNIGYHLIVVGYAVKILKWYADFMQPIEEQALDETIAELKDKAGKDQAKKMLLQ